MNLKDFYGELERITPEYQWEVKEDGRIRGKKVVGKAGRYKGKEITVCPATAHYEKCRNTGICDIQAEISRASDNTAGHDPEIRTKLLEICKLI